MTLLRTLLAACVVALGAVASEAAPVEAKGGWAIVSYDPLPELVAGERSTVTFHVLQHGVNPVDVDDDWGSSTLELRVTGTTSSVDVAAVPTDIVGQFSARIEVPAGDAAALQVLWNGGLILQEASINVPIADRSASRAFPDWAPIGFGAVAFAGLGLVVSDGRARRRATARTEQAPV